MTTASMEQLIEAIRENTKVQRKLLDAMETQKVHSPWVGPEEAARILGLPLSKSQKHRRRLVALVRRGVLTKVRDGRPPAYYREEVMALSEKVAAGRVVI